MNKKNTDYLTYQLYRENVLADTLPCAYPGCPSTGSYSSAGSYTRSLICYTNGTVECHTICVDRVGCTSCEHTHALLPSVIIPHSPFSFHFVISLLYDFITHKYDTVESLCHHYDISVSTLYRIWHRFQNDKKLMLGIMEDSCTCAKSFLCSFRSNRMADVDVRLWQYFQMQGTSFLQAECRLRLKQQSKDAGPDASP